MRVLMIAPPGAGKGNSGRADRRALRHPAHRDRRVAARSRRAADRARPGRPGIPGPRRTRARPGRPGHGAGGDGRREGGRRRVCPRRIPRNMPQARATYLIGLELGMTADVALHLQAGDAELMRRLLARAALEHRSDDTADIIAQRLALYHEVTSPIISWYRDRGILVSVDAMRSAQQVGREILAALEAMRPFLDQVPALARRSVDLTGLGDAFGATGPAAGVSG